MITSDIFELEIPKGLTKKVVENFFRKKNINPVKWAVVRVLQNYAKILVSFQKKPL